MLSQHMQGSGEGTGRLEATGKEVADWLAAGCGGLEPWRWAGGAAADGCAPEDVAAAAAADEAVAARVASAYAAVADFEATHHLNLQVCCQNLTLSVSHCTSTYINMVQIIPNP